MGGAWYSLKEGQKTTNRTVEDGQSRTNVKLDELSKDLSSVKDKYLSKELDLANEKALQERMNSILERIRSLESRLDAK